MLLTTWGDAIRTSFFGLGPNVLQVVVLLLVALIIFAVGWVVGSFIGKLVAKAIRAIKVDTALREAGVESTLQKGGIALDSGAFVGSLVKWFIVAVFLLAALQMLGLTQVTLFLQVVVVNYLPRVIIAVIILLVAVVIADVVKRVVSASSAAAGVTSGNAVGLIAKWAILVFAVLAALDQLQVAPTLIQTLALGIVISLSLAFGLAFGLGGRDAAARAIERIENQINHRR
ncbi:MAG: hypothetical protein RL094_23 [Candidatus Parcubacteria bacterium]|jgi:hypothetical protein